MWAAAPPASSYKNISNNKPHSSQILGHHRNTLPPLLSSSSSFISVSSSRIPTFGALVFSMDATTSRTTQSSFPQSNNKSGGRGRGRGRGRGGEGGGRDKIDSLGRLLTRILRHTASQLNIKMRSDGYAKVQDLLKLNLKTMADIPLRSHTIDDVREAVRMDNKQRFSLVEENGELLIRANQGHSLKTVATESLLTPIMSAEEVPVCVHGTYRENLDAILEHGLKRMKRLHVHFSRGLPTDADVTSGVRYNVNVLIFLDVKKAMEDGMKFYISENKVILTEGFDGIVPVKYFEKIESWPNRQLLHMSKKEAELASGIQNIKII